MLLAALLDKQDGSSALPLLGEATQKGVSAHYRQMQKQTVRARRAEISSLLKRLFVPWPAALESVHPSWIDELLREEDPQIAAVLGELLPPLLKARRTQSGNAPASSKDLKKIVENMPQPLKQLLSNWLVQSLHLANEEDTCALSQLDWSAARWQQTLSHLGYMVLTAMLSRLHEARRLEVMKMLPEPYRRKIFKPKHKTKILLPASWRKREISLVENDSWEIFCFRWAGEWLAIKLSQVARQQLVLRLPVEWGKILKSVEVNADEENIDEPQAILFLKRADAWARSER